MNFDGNSMLSLVGKPGVSSITTTDGTIIGGPITATGDLKINPVLVDSINNSNEKLVNITVSPQVTTVNSELDVSGDVNALNFNTNSTNLNAVAVNVSNNTSVISLLQNKTQNINATATTTTISNLFTNKNT